MISARPVSRHVRSNKRITRAVSLFLPLSRLIPLELRTNNPVSRPRKTITDSIVFLIALIRHLSGNDGEIPSCLVGALSRAGSEVSKLLHRRPGNFRVISTVKSRAFAHDEVKDVFVVVDRKKIVESDLARRFHDGPSQYPFASSDIPLRLLRVVTPPLRPCTHTCTLANASVCRIPTILRRAPLLLLS